MKNGKLFVIVLGLFGLIPLTLIAKLPILDNSVVPFGIYILYYATAGYFISQKLTSRQTLLTILYLWLMIPVMVLVDVTQDWLLWGVDRNLFPIEMIIYAVIMPVCLFLGLGIYKVSHLKKAPENRGD